MAEAWDEIQALKNKRNALREKIEKRKKERHGFLYKIVDVKPKIEAGGVQNFDAARNLTMSTKDTPLDMETGIEKAILQMFSSSNLVLPIISTQIMEKLEKHLSRTPTRASVDYILGKLATQGAVNLQNVTIDQEMGCEVIAVNSALIEEMHQEHVNEHFDMKDEFKHKMEMLDDVGCSPAKSAKVDNNDGAASDEIMSLLALPSTREKQSKQVGEEILELLTKPTAKERSVVEKFKSHGGAQVMEFCPHGTKVECLKAQQAMAEMEAKKRRERKLEKQQVQEEILKLKPNETETMEQNTRLQNDDGTKVTESAVESLLESENLKSNELNGDNTNTATEDLSEEDNISAADTCTKLHFKKIIQLHTDESLGDCSFLNTCFHMATCKYVHYEVDTLPSINNTKPAIVKSKFLKRGIDPSVTLYPPQWIQCDLRFLDMTVLGKFAVVMADPPWDIHMELPYGTMSDDEMRQLGVPALQDDGLIFLWVTGRAMELGRECLQLWGYERVDELIWVKTNQLQRIIRTGRTGHWLNHGKEHCLVGMKGNPKNLNRGLDCDVIVAEVRATSHKPDEIYGIIERLSPGTRKIELFGRPHNVQPNWITLGNQLDGIRLVDPELITQFQKRYPDGNCMAPEASVGVTTTVPLTASTPTVVKN